MKKMSFCWGKFGIAGVMMTAVALTSMGFGLTQPISSAFAAELPDYQLQVSPTQQDLGELEPGKTYTGYFEVQNSGQKPYVYSAEVSPYSVTNQNYNPDYSKRSGYTEIVDWITLENDRSEVEPNSVAKVRYKVEVPKDAPAGGQNAAVLVKIVDDEAVDTTGVKTINQIAFLMYSNVSGETRTEGKILDNKLPSFLFNPPVVATSTVQNDGNVYTRASYELQVKEFFGGKVVYTNSGEPETKVIFPETSRYNEVSWEDAPQLGLFKVKQTVKIFDEVSEVEKIVFLCPMWFLVVIIIFVAVLVFMIVSRIGKKKEKE